MACGQAERVYEHERVDYIDGTERTPLEDVRRRRLGSVLSDPVLTSIGLLMGNIGSGGYRHAA